MILDSAAGGSFMGKPINDCMIILENVASNHSQYSEREVTARKGTPGRYEVNNIELLLAKFDTLNQRLDKMEKAKVNSVATNQVCDLCREQGHTAVDCTSIFTGEKEDTTEQVAASHNFYDTPRREKSNPYSNTYNPGWKNHPNFSWKNNPVQGTSNQQPNFRPSNHFINGEGNPVQTPSIQQSVSRLENLMENFVTNQKQTNDSMANSIQNLAVKVENITLHNKMLENQIAQLMPSSNNSPGKFPGKTVANPAENVNAVTLRSGKKLDRPVSNQNDNIEIDEDASPMVEKPEKERLEKEKVSSSKPQTVYRPPIPFPQRLF
ncbi:uncharacterized protein LOC109794317 [Cajanus cajan]|nr:uncharacterized protein LOC109794317 [Cajanus cajan]